MLFRLFRILLRFCSMRPAQTRRAALRAALSCAASVAWWPPPGACAIGGLTDFTALSNRYILWSPERSQGARQTSRHAPASTHREAPPFSRTFVQCDFAAVGERASLRPLRRNHIATTTPAATSATSQAAAGRDNVRRRGRARHQPDQQAGRCARAHRRRPRAGLFTIYGRGLHKVHADTASTALRSPPASLALRAAAWLGSRIFALERPTPRADLFKIRTPLCL